MNRLTLLLGISLSVSLFSVSAQNAPPVVASPIGDFTEYAGAPFRSIELSSVFSDPDASNAVRFTTVLGNIDIALYGQQKPITVTNFLKYVDQGRFFLFDSTAHQTASSFIHRSIAGFIIQGGGYIGTVNPSPTPGSANNALKPTQVLLFPRIQNEPGISNKRGTIAMAQNGSDPDSAKSEWFINLADNSNLDVRFNNAGPYTVFGRVVGNGMTVVDAIAAVPRFNAGAPFDNLPLRNYASPNPVKVANLVSIPSISQIPPLSFSAMSDSSNVSVALSGTKLLVTGNTVGTAHVTVTATDLDGATISQTFTVNVVAAPGRFVNLATRMQVGTGDNALITGFIMKGSAPKRLAIRAIGPSSGLNPAVADPILELHDSSTMIASNDNWGDAANKQDVTDVNLAPGSPGESVILTTVPSDPNYVIYTAVMRGVNDTTGLGVVELYDLDSGPDSTLLNVSTRGPVGADPNALFGGFTLGGTDSKTVLIRAIGPSLAQANVPNALADPTLELHDSNGSMPDTNDDWMDSAQKTQIQNSGLAPTNAKESAILKTLPAGAYTVIVRGANGGTGVGSVEIYQLQ